MTKISTVANMTEQNNLDDIFDVKRPKIYEYITTDTKEIIDSNFENNNVIKIDKDAQKRKRAKNSEQDNFVLDKLPTELNIRIEKDSNKTIRLELRYPENGEAYPDREYDATNGEEMNGERSVVSDLEMEGVDVEQNGDYIQGNEDSNGVVSDILTIFIL
ncbi:hypothetical protein NE865_06551 [Phthorimaea operculella]|nr:hypothetical protein NE865_06551 [Phthorimaea operculella]